MVHQSSAMIADERALVEAEVAVLRDHLVLAREDFDKLQRCKEQAIANPTQYIDALLHRHRQTGFMADGECSMLQLPQDIRQRREYAAQNFGIHTVDWRLVQAQQQYAHYRLPAEVHRQSFNDHMLTLPSMNHMDSQIVSSSSDLHQQVQNSLQRHRIAADQPDCSRELIRDDELPPLTAAGLDTAVGHYDFELSSVQPPPSATTTSRKSNGRSGRPRRSHVPRPTVNYAEDAMAVDRDDTQETNTTVVTPVEFTRGMSL